MREHRIRGYKYREVKPFQPTIFDMWEREAKKKSEEVDEHIKELMEKRETTTATPSDPT